MRSSARSRTRAQPSQNVFRSLLTRLAAKHGWLRPLYLRWVRPHPSEYADYLRSRGELHHIGSDVGINLGVSFTDPAYVSIGNNVVLSDCTFVGHDGVVAVLYNAYGESVDAVGKIVVHDNVFIGHGAVILRGVSIGPNAVVAAGAVVCNNVAPGTVVGGVPARPIGRTEDLLRKLSAETDTLPWAALIRNRKGGFDPAIEPELMRARLAHFFPGTEDRDE